MKKRALSFIGIFLLFAIPVSVISKYIDFDKASAITFVLVASILLLINRKKIDLEKMAFPVFYALLIRTKVGIKLMDRLAEKHRELIKLLGLCFIGLGFTGMLFIVINFIVMLFQLVIKPLETSQGVALLVPFTNIPGIGYLSFWYFIIGIFSIAVIHEFAHGVMARAHNLNVKSSGVGFFAIFVPLIPLAFVEPDEKRLRKESDHVQYSILSASPSINIIAALILVLLLPYVANPYAYAPFEEKITEPLGISFQAIQEGYPAQASGLEPDMIINKVDGKDITNYPEFVYYMQTTKPGQEVNLASKDQTYTITTTNHPDNKTTWGYIGVIGPRNEREVKPKYQRIKQPYFWVKGLLMWLFILNLLVGLINLLPIYVTDGGRMFGVALLKIIKDKKKAAKIYSFLATLFLATIVISLIINYGSKLIGLF